MASISALWERISGPETERALGLQPRFPNVALQLELGEFSGVKLRRRRGGRPVLEAHHIEALERPGVPATMFQPLGESVDSLAERLGVVLQSLGVRTNRVSIVLPDNLAKVSLLQLPERPATRRQLEEIINFKMRRAVPFRISESRLSYQLLPGEGGGVAVLVALMRRDLVALYEAALAKRGLRVGLVDLATPNLVNLARPRLDEAAKSGDVALLNCASACFSLIIVREGRLVFYRCKTYPLDEQGIPRSAGVIEREIVGSLSYYEEKLEGKGIGTVLLRAPAAEAAALEPTLLSKGVGRVEPIDAAGSVRPANGSSTDPELALRLAPAIGAALGRG